MHLPCKVRKFVRDHSDLSVSEIQQACSAGRVRHLSDGRETVGDVHESFVFEHDVVLLDGTQLTARNQVLCFALNKPKSVTTTVRDPKGKQDLGRFMAQLPRGVFPVGRLDRDSTGVLLLTNDGDLASVISRPEHRIAKLYWLWLNEEVKRDDVRLQPWTTGMPMQNDVARVEAVELLSSCEDMSELLVTLKQGMNRQIRRMCRASDLRLLHLHRKAVGPITDGNLALGQVRALTAAELSELWSEGGGPARLRALKVLALEQEVQKARAAERPLIRLESWIAGHRCELLSGD